jgi:hypothetical protein
MAPFSFESSVYYGINVCFADSAEMGDKADSQAVNIIDISKPV